MTKEELLKHKLVKKSRSSILRIIFGRTAIILTAVLLQVILLIGIMQSFGDYIPVFFGGQSIFALILVLYIINKDDNPTIQLSWTILIMLSPVIGGLLFLFVRTNLGHRILAKRLSDLYGQTKQHVQQSPEVHKKLEEADKGTARLADYIRDNGNFAVYQNTQVTYLPLGEAKLEEVLRQLEKAEHFIFLEYFILAKGTMWEQILGVLARKAREGVEVRVMYDGTCALNLLPYKYPSFLEEVGIKCKMFAPIYPVLSTHYNNRDHRKILVIDGKVGFTGGINISDEYINYDVIHGHWKDTAVMLKGDAVQGLTQMFLQLWNISETKPEDYEKYLSIEQETYNEKGFVLPYGDSPFDSELIGETVYLDILNRAEDYVHMMSPYLILDHEMVNALCFAAKRGVDVKLLLPHIPDKVYAYALARSHYAELIRAGVQIYEYTPGFVHAKVFVSDDIKAVVGTINLDYRSLYLHFECAAFLYDVPEIATIEKDFQETLAKSQKITLEHHQNTNFFVRLLGKILKVFAPLM